MRSWKTLADRESGPNTENNDRMEYLWGEEKNLVVKVIIERLNQKNEAVSLVCLL